MAIVTAPLLSFNASGSIAKSVVYSRWKGIPYARQHVVPANPNTIAQQDTRKTFQWVHDAYKYVDALVQAPWILYAKGQKFTGPNAWMTANLSPLRAQTDLANIVFAKSVAGGPPAFSITITPGANQLTLVGVPGDAPTGWTLEAMVGIAMKDVAPTGEMETVISKALEKTATPWSVIITGLTTAQVYRCGVFFRYLRNDGKIAYGGQVTGTGTPT